MPKFLTATVEQILVNRPGLQRVLLVEDLGRAYALTEIIGPVAVGDQVVINTTAVDLNLGTGGWHVIHWNLSRDQWTKSGIGHVMKLRYTGEQIGVGAIEEIEESKEVRESKEVNEVNEVNESQSRQLYGRPAVVCQLHSQIAAVTVAAKSIRPDIRIAYLMTDQAGLPIAISDLVYSLRERNLIDVTVTVGQAFGGEIEAVNTMSALTVVNADMVIVAPGPGVVGTGTTYGYSSLDAVWSLQSAILLGGTAYFALRWSDADSRERHQGLSHHSKTVLEILNSISPTLSYDVGIPVPRSKIEVLVSMFEAMGLKHGWASALIPTDVPDVAELFHRFDLKVESMGRSATDDPSFYAFAAAAGTAAAANA